MTRTSRRARALSCLALAAAIAAPAARADGMRRLAPPPAVAQECGSCHVSFPPGALPAASWDRLMNGLARHYGTDASIDDAATAKTVRDWLVAHAATGRRAATAPPEDRITRSAWFVREHDEVPAAAWKRPAIKSASNCAACHDGAAHGDFNEHAVRIPR